MQVEREQCVVDRVGGGFEGQTARAGNINTSLVLFAPIGVNSVCRKTGKQGVPLFTGIPVNKRPCLQEFL